MSWHSANLAWLESLRDDGGDDIAPAWRRYFDALDGGEDGASHSGPRFDPPSLFGDEDTSARSRLRQQMVDRLVAAHRRRGHEAAALDPLTRRVPEIPELSPEHHGLGDRRSEERYYCDVGDPGMATLEEILRRLRRAYGGSVSAQLSHIRDERLRGWVQERVEHLPDAPPLSDEERLRILRWLVRARVFDETMQKRYLGSKTFSAEGTLVMVPMIAAILEEGARHGLAEVVLAMTHRGRLNVLHNLVERPAWLIMREFEDDNPRRFEGRGDVSYHLGASTDVETPQGEVHLSLCFNPSHLESVNGVAQGRLRAKQERADDRLREAGMALLLHGDAGFAGEGAAQESLNLSALPAYETGGTIHLVVDNQIGFTTGPEQGRSSSCASDVAKMVDAPILYVNGADAEAAVRVMKLATQIRYRFHRDVVVELRGFRRQGHNELDEPAFTQPRMYARIGETTDAQRRYAETLIDAGLTTEAEVDGLADEIVEALDDAHERAQSSDEPPEPSARGGVWSDYEGGADASVAEVDTGVEEERLRGLLERLNTIPDGFDRHDKLTRLAEGQAAMIEGERPLDWAAAEALAFATLAVEGTPVRLTGQDSERGTFGHRHAVLHDAATGERYRRFSHLAEDQAPVTIANSPLSELGVLAFEYGYSLDRPEALVCWEAQFGDFANAAQVVIDQYVASAEDKWRRLSGLVLLLPHGFEGKGPEHSSARLSRWLDLAAEDNIQIAQPTTPAQIFHLLRRQVRRRWRKPLIVLTPKSLLRHEMVTSEMRALSEGRFRRVLADPDPPDDTERLLLCSGKVFYDLAERRSELGREDIEIVRLEQIYPLDGGHLAKALAHLPDGIPCTWVQEEPENEGAWPWLRRRHGQRLLGRFPFERVCRPASASPATGAKSAHHHEQERLIDRAFGVAKTEETTT